MRQELETLKLWCDIALSIPETEMRETSEDQRRVYFPEHIQDADFIIGPFAVKRIYGKPKLSP